MHATQVGPLRRRSARCVPIEARDGALSEGFAVAECQDARSAAQTAVPGSNTSNPLVRPSFGFFEGTCRHQSRVAADCPPRRSRYFFAISRNARAAGETRPPLACTA